MTTIKRIAARHATTPLERHVRRWLNDQGKNSGYDNGAAGAYEDLMRGGCAAGAVRHLVYSLDTVRFYRRHRREIDAMLGELCSESGQHPAELFGRQWDREDPLAREDRNQNLLAWFGFEEAARAVFERAEEDAS